MLSCSPAPGLPLPAQIGIGFGVALAMALAVVTAVGLDRRRQAVRSKRMRDEASNTKSAVKDSGCGTSGAFTGHAHVTKAGHTSLSGNVGHVSGAWQVCCRCWEPEVT